MCVLYTRIKQIIKFLISNVLTLYEAETSSDLYYNRTKSQANGTHTL